jgi:rRNA maturation endonuclease Nob1
MGRKSKITEELLRKMYLEEKKTIGTIARELEVHKSTVLYHLKKYNIPRRSWFEEYVRGVIQFLGADVIKELDVCPICGHELKKRR